MASLKAADLFSVKDLVFVITGGGSGLGSMMTQTLATNGAAKVYILGRRLEKLEEVAKTGPTGVIVPIQTDVTSKDSLGAAASQIKSFSGFVNAVIANSGVLGEMLGLPRDGTQLSMEELQSKLWAVSAEDFTQIQHVNVTGAYFTMVAFLNLLDAGNKDPRSPTTQSDGWVRVKSQFIVTTSVSGFTRSVFSNFAYPASKAAANHLVKLASSFLVPYDIRVNGICPGIYKSEMSPYAGTKEGDLDRAMVPLRRAGDEEDMAGVILSLCGRGGAMRNGLIYVTDGGRICGVPSTY